MGKDQELLEAARNGNVPVVEKILSQRAKRSGPLASLRRGPGANVQDSSGYSALHHAALNGHRDIVELLLTHEASTNIVDVKGSSPLHLAAWTGNEDIVRLLLCHGPSVPNVNLTNKDRETSMHCAAQYGHTAVVSLLLEHSCDPTIRNNREETALDLAAQYGRLETVELLVRTHPELIHPYARGSSGNVFPHTPLHLASRNGHKAVVSVLLNAGFDVNVRTAAGTALHEAALCGKVEVVRSLLEGGVDLQAQDQYHKTVMDVLGQFQTHVTQEITAIIKKHRAMLGSPNDTEDKENANPLPPIPIPSLGSPYENVRLTPKGGRVMESPTTSPTHWEFYDVPPKGREGGDDRRISGTSAMSVGSDNLYQTPPAPKSLESSFLSEELSDLSSRHSSLYQAPRDRDLDQMSISSNSSTGPSPSPRDRFLIDSHRGSRELLDGDRRSGGQGHDNYLPMAPGTGVKVSPTPPKKPPRRNLSVSPTHLQPHELLDGPTGAYEYLFLARSGHRSQDLEDASIRPSMIRDRELMMRRGRSADHPDQYVDMKMRQSMLGTYENFEQAMEFLKKANRKSDGTGDEGEHERRPAYENVDRSFNILVPPTEITFRNYQRRKLRRHNDNAYENYEPRQLKSGSVDSAGDRVEAAVDGTTATFVSSAYIRLKSSEESLLDEKRPASTPDADKPSSILSSSAGGEVPTKKKKKVVLPLSPTHYKQPPTPDHPPPSAIQAEKSIHDRIRPLSQEYKRRSRDIETETEEDFFPSLDASSGSLSSSVSLSDKSVSTDNVEEFLGDVPFAGLFKGSTTPAPDGTGRSAERPKTLRRLKNVYENVGQEAANEDLDDGAGGKRSSRGSDKTQSLSILSPFDEQEEWAKISEIMASFGTGLVRESVFVNELEKEFQNRLGLSRSDSGSSPSSLAGSSVGQWLASLGLVEYESNFINNGFDDIDFIFGVLDENDLKEMGISNLKHCTIILEAVKNLPSKLQRFGSNGVRVPETVDDWLRAIHLDCYVDIFHKHLYTDMDRILRIWEVEVTTVLEINKLGHRKRILASVGDTRRGSPGPNLDEINADLKQLSSINQLKEEIKEKLPTDNPSKSPVVSGTGTLRHSHKKGRPPPPPPGTATPVKTANGSEDLSIRDPSELLVGVPATLTTQWRHQPQVLVNGSVTYVASYLGSTLVKELRGTESTKKSIQKLKKSPKESKRTPDVILSVSYRGVKFLNATNKDIICEHEIRNIHCACQDADDLTHFAYITKDHLTKDHYCHVFCVHTMDQATEVILTLGQAFEVAYQMALREQFSHNRGHIRSQSANQIVQKGPNGNHARSQSVNEIKVNGSQALPQNSNIEKHTPTSEKNDISLSLKREQVGSETSSVKSDSESSNLQSSIGRAPIVFTEEM